MKHPAHERKLKQMEYDKLYKHYAGRYLTRSLCGLVGLGALVYLLISPAWPPAVIGIFYCSGFVLCISVSAWLAKVRARDHVRVSNINSGTRRATDDGR